MREIARASGRVDRTHPFPAGLATGSRPRARPQSRHRRCGRRTGTSRPAMCGRFTRNYIWQQIHALYRLTAPAAIPNLRPIYNVCPTDPADIIVANDGKHEFVEMRWGLVPFGWSKPLKDLRLATFNARVETVTTKPFFREPFKSKRCLMPVSGYYEWQDLPSGKQPWYFTARDDSPVLIVAGLWDEWKSPETGEPIKSCAMIICEPNEFVAEVHDRMPVLLRPEQFDLWLSGDMGVEELQLAPAGALRRRGGDRHRRSAFPRRGVSSCSVQSRRPDRDRGLRAGAPFHRLLDAVAQGNLLRQNRRGASAGRSGAGSTDCQHRARTDAVARRPNSEGLTSARRTGSDASS